MSESYSEAPSSQREDTRDERARAGTGAGGPSSLAVIEVPIVASRSGLPVVTFHVLCSAVS
jgi:hypothetical protein